MKSAFAATGRAQSRKDPGRARTASDAVDDANFDERAKIFILFHSSHQHLSTKRAAAGEEQTLDDGSVRQRPICSCLMMVESRDDLDISVDETVSGETR